jgi:hypothetical protein
MAVRLVLAPGHVAIDECLASGWSFLPRSASARVLTPWRFISGNTDNRMVELGWKSMGVLELTALPSIDEEMWVPLVQETDALLVGDGDVLYLCHWMREAAMEKVRGLTLATAASASQVQGLGVHDLPGCCLCAILRWSYALRIDAFATASGTPRCSAS